MTRCTPLGEFQTKVQYRTPFKTLNVDAELSLTWVSSGHYVVRIHSQLTDDEKLVISSSRIILTKKWIGKTAELYPKAERMPRTELYKPFYENFQTDDSLIDSGHDILFQAFKDQFEDRVILTNYKFCYGMPLEKLHVLSLEFSEFKRLKDFLESKGKI